jgi:hypothetical protein
LARDAATHRIESIFRDWIAFEEIWDVDLEAVTSKVVGKELIVSS